MALRIRVFGLYRSAIRQQRKTFANDFEAQRLAMDDIRRLFREGSSETDPAKINKMIGKKINKMIGKKIIPRQTPRRS
eukprot:g78984.t1